MVWDRMSAAIGGPLGVFYSNFTLDIRHFMPRLLKRYLRTFLQGKLTGRQRKTAWFLMKQSIL